MKFCCSSGAGNDTDFLGQPQPQHHQQQQRSLIVIDLDGMLVPTYKRIPRQDCRLLTYTWQRRWTEVISRCDHQPEESFMKTDHSGRTALHLATFHNDEKSLVACTALLRANRHAILVEDFSCYTPLHNLGFFEGTGDKIMALFCDTALMVEQELQGRGTLPTPSRTSPLYLAAKRDAPKSTLFILLQTRSRQKSKKHTSNNWIAPITGGESYWDPQQTLDKCSSPLEILLRGRASCFEFERLSHKTKQQMKAMVLQLLGGGVSLDSSSISSDNSYDKEDDAEMTDHQYNHAALKMLEKCLLFLRENVRTTTRAQHRLPSLLHTVASLKVPVPIFFQVAVYLFPEQTTRCDDTGKYPLYHILKAKHPYATQQLIRILFHSKTSKHLQAGDNTPTASKLRHHPLYQIQECLALALEIELTWEDGLRDIIQANSDVLCTEDNQTGLVPAFWAASREHTALDTIFLLLLAGPQVIQYNTSAATAMDYSVKTRRETLLGAAGVR